MKHFYSTNRLRLIFLAGLLVCVGIMQAKNDDLQEYINKAAYQGKGANRAADDFIEVDLSSFSATTRTSTLQITNGKRYRFINGTLTRANSLDAAIVHIGGGSCVDIGNGATFDASNTTSRKEAVLIDGGELIISSNGKLKGHKYTVSDAGFNFMDNPFAAVLMTSDNDVFTMEDGSEVFNSVVCQATKASVNFKGGTMTEDAHMDNFQSGSDINFLGIYSSTKYYQITLTEKDNVIVAPTNCDWLCHIYVYAPKKIDNDILIKNCHPYFLKNEPSLWIERVLWQGNSKYQTSANYGDNTIRLSFDDLQDFIDSWPREKDPAHPNDWHCGCVVSMDPWIIDPFPLTVPCSGLNVKKEVTFPEDDLQWMIDGRPEQYEDSYDCEGQINQGENDIKIKSGSTVYIRWIHWRGCGCANKHIWVWGTVYIEKTVWFSYYWRFIHVMPGGRVVITDLQGECDETVFHIEGGEVTYGGGKCSGGNYGWYCTGGTIYIRGGWLSGGTSGGWTGPGGRSYHYDGTVHGGIHNYGYHYFYGGTCSGGGSYTIYNYKGGHFYYYGGTCSDGGKIWNEGDLYIDGGGSVSCGDIYCIKGGCIYILKKLTFTLRLVFTEENIVPGATVVVGGDGYTLTQDDIDKLQIDLPDGYEWRYDGACGCITIIQTTGINRVGSEQPTVKQTYDAIGRQVEEGSKGLSIQRMSDGSVRKVTTK